MRAMTDTVDDELYRPLKLEINRVQDDANRPTHWPDAASQYFVGAASPEATMAREDCHTNGAVAGNAPIVVDQNTTPLESNSCTTSFMLRNWQQSWRAYTATVAMATG